MTSATEQLVLEATRAGPGAGLPGYPQSALLNQAHAWWLAARGDHEMPPPAAVADAALDGLRAQSLLFAVAADPLDFRYMVVGSKMLALSNADYTGQWISAIPHQRPPSLVHDHLAAAVDARAPVRAALPYVGRSRVHATVFHIVLPLSADGTAVTQVLVCVDLSQVVRLTDGPEPFNPPG